MADAGTKDAGIVKRASAQGLVMITWKSSDPYDVYRSPEYFVRKLNSCVPTDELVFSVSFVVKVSAYGGAADRLK